jgi:hypothetical protein
LRLVAHTLPVSRLNKILQYTSLSPFGFKRRHIFSGTPGGNRTPDTRFRKPLLYPLSYGRRKMAERVGFEPTKQVFTRLIA